MGAYELIFNSDREDRIREILAPYLRGPESSEGIDEAAETLVSEGFLSDDHLIGSRFGPAQPLPSTIPALLDYALLGNEKIAEIENLVAEIPRSIVRIADTFDPRGQREAEAWFRGFETVNFGPAQWSEKTVKPGESRKVFVADSYPQKKIWDTGRVLAEFYPTGRARWNPPYRIVGHVSALASLYLLGVRVESLSGGRVVLRYRVGWL